MADYQFPGFDLEKLLKLCFLLLVGLIISFFVIGALLLS